MKKYLMFGMAVLALASCSKSSDVYDPTASKDRAQYEQAFINAFGVPAGNQDWGFGTSSYTRATTATRAAVANPSVTEVGQTYNSFMAESYASAMDVAQQWKEKWNSAINYDHSDYVVAKPWYNSGWTDRYYQITASVVPSNIDADLQAAYKAAVLEQVPESQNNISKAQSTGYSLTTKGGPVTVTPIYHNSNSDDKVSYYYYPAGTTPNVKSLPKYTIGQLGNDGAMLQSHSLVYVDESGNVSYDFPANYVICFMVANMSGASGNVQVLTSYDFSTNTGSKSSYPSAPEYYGDGNYNQEIHTVQGWNYTPVTTPHAATFSASNVSFVGFEDWNDMDYNDLIFAVGGTTGGGNITIPDGDDDDEEFAPDVRIMAEDLNASEKSDFDFNDVVFDVQWITGGAKIRIMAAGGTYPLRINGEDALEVHGLFEVSTKTMVNTFAGKKTDYDPVIKTIAGNFINSSTNENDASLIKVEVNKGTGYVELTAPTGKVASKICVDPKVDWCDEYQDIDKKWSGNFTKYVGGQIDKFWD